MASNRGTLQLLSRVQTQFDTIIIGAGIAGINAAYRLQKKLPSFRYAIFEARNNIGGTWDFFRYPGQALTHEKKSIY